MEGGDSIREVFSFILDVIVQVLGNYLYKLLDRISLSGSWKTLHGVVKRSLIKKMITSINKKTSVQARLF